MLVLLTRLLIEIVGYQLKRININFQIRDIILPTHFYGAELSYQHDLAIVIVKKSFEYRSFIRPVCLDFRPHFNEEQLKQNNFGKVITIVSNRAL